MPKVGNGEKLFDNQLIIKMYKDISTLSMRLKILFSFTAHSIAVERRPHGFINI